MRRLKSIDEIYDEVKDFGLVITNDISLETALNARIDKPFLGMLAITPRHLAAKVASRILGTRTLTDLELVSRVSEETGLGLRQVYSEIENIREIRTHTMDVRKYLTSHESKKIYDSYSACPTLEKAMGLIEPSDPVLSDYFQRFGRIAVIGPELFDDLDKHCNPFDAEIIDMFSDDEYVIEEIHSVGNDRQLAENAVSAIDPLHPKDYAIVINTGGSIASAVRSALYRSGLPFINDMAINDIPQVRDYLNFISLSLDYPILRVKAVKELFNNYNGSFSSNKIDNYLLHKIDEENLRRNSSELRDLMKRIYEKKATFGEVNDVIVRDQAKSQITLFLNELGIRDCIIEPSGFSDLRFALENIGDLTMNMQRPENEKKGVLIVDCKRSVYIDRPVVIYLGMEQEWNVQVVGKRYLDTEEESERNAVRLEGLLQQGQKRLYCVNYNKKGKEVRPSLSFDLIFNKPCNSFEDICVKVVKGAWSVPQPVGMLPIQSEIDCDTGDRDDVPGGGPFSKSSLNNFAACPRRFMFNILIPTPEESMTEFGQLIHDFAEAYAIAPDVVGAKSTDELVDMVADKYAGLSSPAMTNLDRDRIRLGIQTIKRYIDSLDIHPELDKTVDADDRNPFLKSFGIEKSSSWCETDHRFDAAHLHGIMDLHVGRTIIDYKTGKIHDAKTIRSSMNFKEISNQPEFQPLIYLALGRDCTGSIDTEFRLFYAMGNDTLSMKPGFDLSENIRTIRIRSCDFMDLIEEDEFKKKVESKLNKDIKQYAGRIIDCIKSYENFSPYSSWYTDSELIDEIVKATGLSKIERKSWVNQLKKINTLISCGMIYDGNTILVPKSTLDDFLEWVDECYERKEECLNNGFPASHAPSIDCRKCNFYEVCTSSVLVDIDNEGGDFDDE